MKESKANIQRLKHNAFHFLVAKEKTVSQGNILGPILSLFSPPEINNFHRATLVTGAYVTKYNQTVL